jgi:hypothetical protein
MNILARLLLLAALLPACSASAAPIYDLASDWSDTNNPNSVWQYRAGGAPIATHFSNWGPGLVTTFTAPQPAWVAAASGPNSVPAWFKSNGAVVHVPNTTTPDPTYDAPSGRVLAHTNDPFTGNDVAASNVLWTSPISGTAVISGDVWQARKSLGRANTWSLIVNGVTITSGVVSSADAFTSSNPMSFASGTGGPGVLTFPVNVGDTVAFQAVRVPNAGDTAGDFVGVDLTISVPEPGSMLAFFFGGLAVCMVRWRRC